ncbi:MAG: polysaccharide pyruvyl transferase family protein, partial [Bacillota bacterium]
MKIGIITFHFPYNCGAALQCYALQRKLESMGHEVCIINYRPWYHQNRYTPMKNPFYWGKRCFDKEEGPFYKKCYEGLKGFVKTVQSWKGNAEVKEKDRKFSRFVKGNLHETSVYRTLEQLRDNPPECDVYISGSDQLWNSGLTDGKFDEAYFMRFGKKSTGRMTYSVGTNFADLKDPAEALKELVKDIDVISIRENRWRSVIEEATGGNKKIHNDLDPTLLLDAADYEPVIPQMEKTEPFILTYSMPN